MHRVRGLRRNIRPELATLSQRPLHTGESRNDECCKRELPEEIPEGIVRAHVRDFVTRDERKFPIIEIVAESTRTEHGRSSGTECREAQRRRCRHIDEPRHRNPRPRCFFHKGSREGRRCGALELADAIEFARDHDDEVRDELWERFVQSDEPVVGAIGRREPAKSPRQKSERDEKH